MLQRLRAPIASFVILVLKFIVFSLLNPSADLLSRTRQALRDIFHVTIDVLPELMQSTTQVIQSRFALASTDDALLWAFAVAGKQKLAFTALPR
jgi:hypothetical protein